MARWRCITQAPITCAASSCGTASGRPRSSESDDDPVDAKYPDGRIAPVSRLAKIFFDAIESGGIAAPGFAEGYRVQQLIDTARRAHLQVVWIDVARETAKEEMRA